VALALAGVLSLTACNPPMPPEVIAALAEQSYTCESGETFVWAVPEIASVAGDWQASVAMNCPEMLITPTETSDANAQIQIGSLSADSTEFASVPFAVDAIVFAITLDGVSGINLDAASIEKIFAGQITSWDDQALSRLNPENLLPAQPIVLANSLSSDQLKPMTDWLSRLAGHEVKLPSASGDPLAAGAISLSSYSVATTNMLTTVNIVTGKNIEQSTAVPDSNGILTAASQWKATSSATGISVALNPSAKPIAPLGLDVMPTPYQAIYPIVMHLTGTESLTTRAVARYLLRQDSQGSLSMSSVVPLPEIIRVVSLTSVSKGLPTPEITEPTN
jgi:hypothetical protein